VDLFSQQSPKTREIAKYYPRENKFNKGTFQWHTIVFMTHNFILNPSRSQSYTVKWYRGEYPKHTNNIYIFEFLVWFEQEWVNLNLMIWTVVYLDIFQWINAQYFNTVPKVILGEASQQRLTDLQIRSVFWVFIV